MEWIADLFGNAFGGAIVAGLFGLIQWRLNRKAQKEDKSADGKIANCAARGVEIKQLQTKVDALMVADRTILYDRIKHLAKSYLKREYITVEEYEDLKAMHKVYHDELGGNGFLDTIMQRVANLEVRAL